MVFNSQAFKAPQLGRKRVSMKKTLGDAAQSGVNPATGEYLSSGERKALFKKRTVSAEKVFGKPGALVKINNLESIVKTGKDEEKKGESSTDTESLGTRVSSLEKSIVTIQESIKKLSEFLVDDAKKEQQLLLKGQKTEDIAKEKQKRRRKEFGLESVAKGIGNTLLAPIKAIGGKVKGILSRVLEFLKILFLGWLTDKGIKAFRAYMDGNKEEFERIRNNIVGALGIVMGIIAGVSGGLAAIPGLVLGIIPIIAKIGTAIVGFLLSPAGLTTLAIAAGIGFANKLGQFAAKSPDIIKGGMEYANAMAELDSKLYERGIDRKGKYLSDIDPGFEKKLTPEDQTFYDEIKKQMDRVKELRIERDNKVKKEQSKIKSTKIVRTGQGVSGGGKKVMRETDEEKKKKKDIKQDIFSEYTKEYFLTESAKVKTKKPPVSTPTSPVTSSAQTERGSGMASFREDAKENAKLQSSVTSSPTPPVTSLAQTRTVPTAEPKKKPTVIFRPNPQVQQKEPASVTNGNSETPNISSSNPNNFYTMYSQIQYNVVR